MLSGLQLQNPPRRLLMWYNLFRDCMKAVSWKQSGRGEKDFICRLPPSLPPTGFSRHSRCGPAPPEQLQVLPARVQEGRSSTVSAPHGGSGLWGQQQLPGLYGHKGRELEVMGRLAAAGTRTSRPDSQRVDIRNWVKGRAFP